MYHSEDENSDENQRAEREQENFGAKRHKRLAANCPTGRISTRTTPGH
jgi:hypothetical protein